MKPGYYIKADGQFIGMRLKPFQFNRCSQICEGSRVSCFRQPPSPAIRLSLSELVNPYPTRCYAAEIMVTCAVRDQNQNMSWCPVTAELWSGESLLWASHIGKDLLGEWIPLVNHRGIRCEREEFTYHSIKHIYFPPVQDCHVLFHLDCLPKELRDTPVELDFTLSGLQGVPIKEEREHAHQ